MKLSDLFSVFDGIKLFYYLIVLLNSWYFMILLFIEDNKWWNFVLDIFRLVVFVFVVFLRDKGKILKILERFKFYFIVSFFYRVLRGELDIV